MAKIYTVSILLAMAALPKNLRARSSPFHHQICNDSSLEPPTTSCAFKWNVDLPCKIPNAGSKSIILAVQGCIWNTITTSTQVRRGNGPIAVCTCMYYSSFQASCKAFQSIRIVSEFVQNDVLSNILERFQMWPSSVNLGRSILCASWMFLDTKVRIEHSRNVSRIPNLKSFAACLKLAVRYT